MTDIECSVTEELELHVESEVSIAEETQIGDEQLTESFREELEKLRKTTLHEIKEREKLQKVKVPSNIAASANSILSQHLATHRGFGEITDAVYAMGRAINKQLCQTPPAANAQKKIG